MNEVVNDRALLDSVIALAEQAGVSIMQVYHRSNYSVERKADNSPATDADHASNYILQTGLRELFGGIPVLSEESDIPTYDERSQWNHYWLVDPLDGTEGFIQGNGEFTVNIALIVRQVPVMGVVHVPAWGVTYAGSTTCGAVKRSSDVESRISTRHLSQITREHPFVIVASKRQPAKQTQALLRRAEEQFGGYELRSVGSALKMCEIAEGKADFQPHFAPTSEWDIAAAQAVLEAAGGIVVDTDFNPLRYNTKPDLLNPFFYAFGDKLVNWPLFLR